MNAEVIAKCPNPECKREYKPEVVPFRSNEGNRAAVRCYECGYQGPSAETWQEAERLHNAICSSVPISRLEALVAEMRAMLTTEFPTDPYRHGLEVSTKGCADRISALISEVKRGKQL